MLSVNSDVFFMRWFTPDKFLLIFLGYSLKSVPSPYFRSTCETSLIAPLAADVVMAA